MGLSYFAAPVAGHLSDRFGCRIVTILGSLTCALSLLVTSFAKSITHLFLSYGLLFGLGAACVRTCTFLVAAKCFYRRRSLATGLVSSGTGLGIFICGPIVQELLDAIGLHNTYRFLIAFALVVCVLAGTFPSIVKEVEEVDKKLEDQVDKEQAIHTKEKQKLCLPRRKMFDCSVWKTPRFTVVTIAYAVVVLGDYVPLMHLVSVADAYTSVKSSSAHSSLPPPPRALVGHLLTFESRESSISPSRVFDLKEFWLYF